MKWRENFTTQALTVKENILKILRGGEWGGKPEKPEVWDIVRKSRIPVLRKSLKRQSQK